MATQGDDYVYLPLVDARKAINVKVNLFAVVVEIGAASLSKGTDYFLKLRIVDPSYMAPGLSVSFFAGSADKLPHVMSSGDLICLHRVTIKVFEGDVYCAFDKRFSSFALYNGKAGSSFNPYQTSQKFRAAGHNIDHIKKLQTWFLDYHHDTGAKNYSLQIKEVKVDMDFDLICRVFHACEIGEDSWIVYVWDGSDCPPLPVQTDLDAEADNPIPLCLEHSPLPKDTLIRFPHVGTVLRIIVGKSFKEIQQSISGGRWFKFRKIICVNEFGIWKGMLQSWSKVSVLSDDDEAVLLRERNYNERIASHLLRRPMSCFPRPSDITDYSDLVNATLMDSLTYSEVTHKCKCVVRVVAACPWQAKDFISIRGQYRVRLTLEDPTARIHAYICNEDGVKFFGDDPAVENLEKKMRKLLGITQEHGSRKLGGAELTTRHPPWVTVCLKSYSIDVDRPWNSRRYRIFATRLLG
ncbi:protection of telomeres protein 1a-like isoform X2 [Wolffia australiana]